MNGPFSSAVFAAEVRKSRKDVLRFLDLCAVPRQQTSGHSGFRGEHRCLGRLHHFLGSNWLVTGALLRTKVAST
jgi:hypothetical protein